MQYRSHWEIGLAEEIYTDGLGHVMRDVQALARLASLNMTMRYVDADKEAMRKVVDLV